LYGIESAVENIIDFLVEQGMAERFGDDVGILPFGKRVSDLYIDPESAVILREAVTKMTLETEDFPILLAVAMTPDVLGLYPKKKDEDRLASLEQEWEGKFLVDPPQYDDYQYEYFMGDLKTAWLIEEWASETDEDTITEMMGIGPGDIRSTVDMMDWLLYAMTEISLIYRPECTKMLRNLAVRVRYGIGRELMELVSLKGVGRARARILYDRGIRNLKDVAKKDVNELGSIPGIGQALARKIKEQTGNAKEEKEERFVPTPIDDEEEAVPVSKPKQRNLFDF
jgi:helicase